MSLVTHTARTASEPFSSEPFTAFLLFSQTDVDALAGRIQRGTCSHRFDVMIGCVTGLDLGPLAQHDASLYGPALSLEKLVEDEGIDLVDITRHETEVVDALLGRTSVPIIEEGVRIDLNPSLKNHLALLLRGSITFHLLFECLVSKGLRKAIFFGPRRSRFRLLERFDLQLMLRPGLTFVPHAQALCAAAGVEVEVFPSPRCFSGLACWLRARIIRASKVALLVVRSVMRPRSGTKPATREPIIVIIRAASELRSIEPVLRRLNREDPDRVLLFADNLLRRSDGTAAVRATHYPRLEAHEFTNPVEIISRFLQFGAFVRKNVARIGAHLQEGLGNSPDRTPTPAELFRRREFGVPTLETMLETVLELRVFALQLVRALARFPSATIITMDTVDRWGALVGAVGRERGMSTVTLQNTALDQMLYPEPLGTDHLVVANTLLKSFLVRSGAPKERVHDCGLPMHDWLIRVGNRRLSVLNLQSGRRDEVRILVATQPFVQAFDYNGDLLRALATVLRFCPTSADVLVKPHPREDEERYRPIVATLEEPRIRLAKTGVTLETMLLETDILISRTSTSIQAAVLAGVAPISYLHNYPENVVKRLDYLTTAATTKAANETELLQSIKGWMCPSSRLELMRRFADHRRDYLYEHCGTRPGSASDFFVELLCSLAPLSQEEGELPHVRWAEDVQ